MNYQEALDYISETYTFGIKLGLENISILLDLLGNPQDKMRYVHVAGTNGKGSTSHMIHYTLIESGYKTGLFISPFLEEFTERMQINGEKIDKQRLADVTSTIKDAIQRMMDMGHPSPSEFEVVMAIAFQYFYEENVEIVVLEVGMGGRLDATNVIKSPEVCVITTIAMDHTDYLGDTLEKIAWEKAGIIKEGCPVVIYPQQQSVMDVLIAECDKMNASYRIPDFSWVTSIRSDLSGQQLRYENEKSPFGTLDFKLPLLGAHQIWNVTVALSALEALKEKGYRITPSTIQRGMAAVKFTGRFEKLSDSPLIVIDGAHNVSGFEALAKTLDTYMSGKLNVVIGILGDKDYPTMLKTILPYVEKFYTVTPDSDRALTAKELAAYIQEKLDYPATPLENTMEGAEIAVNAKDGEATLFVGSLYMIGEARTALRKLLSEQG